jgi:hypothetical protein
MMSWDTRPPEPRDSRRFFVRVNVFCAASATLFQSLTHAEAHS